MKRNTALFFILAGILLIAAAGFIVLKPESKATVPGEISTAPEVGAISPDFSLPSINYWPATFTALKTGIYPIGRATAAVPGVY